MVGVVQDVADREAGGRLVLSLEGGYHPDVLAACVTATLRRLLDPTVPIDDPYGPTTLPGPDLTPRTQAYRRQHGL